MLFNIHKVYTIYDYGSKGQSILEFTKDQPQRVDITAGRRNELLGVVEGSTIDYTPEPLQLIDDNQGFRFSADIKAPTAIYIYMEKGHILDQLQVTPQSVDQDLLLEEFTHDSRLIYCFFLPGKTQITIRGRKTKDDSICSKLVKSPRDLRLRRLLLEHCKLEYRKQSLKDLEVFSIEEAARYMKMSKGTLYNKINNDTFLKPISIDGTKVYLKKDLLNYLKKL